jgi:hypothetical protein
MRSGIDYSIPVGRVTTQVAAFHLRLSGHRGANSVRKNLVAALVSRREVTRMSSTFPCWSTAPPQVVGLAVDLNEHLVEVPCVSRASPAPAQGVGVDLPELRAPLPHRLMGDHDPR